MGKRNETGMDRLKKVTLWQWGLIAIFAGIVSHLVTSQFPMARAGTAEARGAEFGRAAGSLLAILVGIGLIIAHFVRRKR